MARFRSGPTMQLRRPLDAAILRRPSCRGRQYSCEGRSVTDTLRFLSCKMTHMPFARR